MANQIYRMKFGADLLDATGVGWQIAGIQIDNPSGSWLRVKGIEQTVAPYTVGWTFPVSPQQASISVLYTNSPSGSLSQQVGTPPVVTLYDSALPAFQGTPTGAGGRVSIVPPSQTAFVALIADLPNLVIPTVALTALQPLVIRKLAGTYDLRDLGGPSGAGYDPRAIISFFWTAQLGASWAWQQGISPEHPYVESPFQDGALFLPQNATLSVAAFVQLSGAEYVLGASDVQVMSMIEYYSEVSV